MAVKAGWAKGDEARAVTDEAVTAAPVRAGPAVWVRGAWVRAEAPLRSTVQLPLLLKSDASTVVRAAPCRARPGSEDGSLDGVGAR